MCGCAGETDSAFCARLNKNCGSVTAPDNCGVTRTVSSCGTCSGTAICGGAGTPNVCAMPPCTFSIITNVYDGPEYWGTITFKNNGPATASNFRVEFDVPSNAHCDHSEAGWTYTTSANHCVYTKNNTSMPAGTMLTFNYSTNSTSFSSASNLVVHDTVCAP